jgi:glycosyltransferase involved in cell wall biosynthesis
MHTHFAWSTSTVVAHLATLVHVPASITLHAKDIYTERPSALRRRLRPYRDIITVCHYNVGFLEGAGVLTRAGSRIRVIPCGVAIPSECHPPSAGQILAVGRLVEKKGFDALLEAAAVVARRHAELRITIVGDGPERQRLEALARDRGIDARVAFLGARPHAETLERIGRAVVFCLPARRAPDGDIDAMPVVLREAMARGVPVIASRLTGIPENVDEQVGWLTRPGSIDDLVGALTEALEDEAGRARRGRTARDRVARFATLDRQVDLLLEVFANHATLPATSVAAVMRDAGAVQDRRYSRSDDDR